MSYCKFSSDNWRSDLYAIPTPNGFIIHLASVRRIGEISEIPEMPLNGNQSQFIDWCTAYQNQLNQVMNSELEEIKLPHAGDTIYCDDLFDFMESLIQIKSIGYRIPPGLIEEVQAEIDAI